MELCFGKRVPLSKLKEKHPYDVVVFWGEQLLESRNRTLAELSLHWIANSIFCVIPEGYPQNVEPHIDELRRHLKETGESRLFQTRIFDET